MVKELLTTLIGAGPFARYPAINFALRREFAPALVVAAIVATAIAAPAGAAVRSDGDDMPLVGFNPLQVLAIPGLTWTLEGRLGTLYDTNFRRTPVPEAGIRFTPAVNLRVGLPVGRQRLFLDADLGRDILVNQPAFSRDRYGFNGGVEWRLGSRCSGVASAAARKQMIMVNDQDELTNTVQTTNSVTATLGCRTPTGIGFGVSFDQRSLTNDTSQRAPFDLRSTIFTPNISYGTSAIGQFSLSATFNETQFPNRAVLTADGPATQGVSIFQGRVGYQREFGTRLQVVIGASYFKTEPSPPAALGIVDNQIVVVPTGGFTGSGYDGSINYSPSSRVNLTLIARRNINVSPNVGALFTLQNSYGADINYQVKPSLNVGIGGSIARIEYKAGFFAPGTVPRANDNFNRAYVSLDYLPAPLYSIGVEVGHQSRRSNPAAFMFDSTTARLNLIVRLGRG